VHQHSHLCVFFCQSSWLELLVKSVFSLRQEDTLHQKDDRAQVRSSPASLQLPGLQWVRSFFCCQSSVTDQEMIVGTAGSGFLDQEDPEVTNKPRPPGTGLKSGGPSTGARHTDLETGARYWSSPSLQSSVFSNQVFSEYDPSSAASLLSSANTLARSWELTARYYSEDVQRVDCAGTRLRSVMVLLGTLVVLLGTLVILLGTLVVLLGTLKGTHNSPQLVRFQEEHPDSRQQRSPRGWAVQLAPQWLQSKVLGGYCILVL